MPLTKYILLSQAVRLFFRTNKSTCQEWLSRIRGVITSVSIECGEPATAVYHGLQRLKELKNGGKGKVGHVLTEEQIYCLIEQIYFLLYNIALWQVSFQFDIFCFC